ncbi:MAG: glycosyltransferase family 4 protein, partial [Candidatus Peribacteraceae bacterium]|nr:glycosyltransferase family 4 protein [Candidatus Peribacteraceae bacterium]
AICMLSLTEKILLTPKALSSDIQVLWIEHDSIGRWLKKNPFLSRLRKLSKHVLTICVSESSRRTYIELGWNPSRVVAIPNGIDPSRFEVDNKNPNNSTNGNKTSIGCVARLHKQKGIDILLRSIADLPQAHLTIVGIGEEKKSLINIIKELRIMDRVQILDKVGKLGEFYKSLDIFVLPSRTNDPFGMVAAEAMCCGIPTVVTSACGISQDINDGKNGIVVKEDSIDALREALSFLMTHADRRKAIGEAGKTKALTEFTIKSMVDAYERCLQS